MNVEQFLLRLGIRTYAYPVITAITAKPEILFGDSISTELGWIYGISAEVNGCTPKDQTVVLPTLAQAGDLYVNLQYGQTWFINDFRMSNLVFNDPSQATTGYTNSQRYFGVNIPMTTDLKQSVIRNPKMASGFSTMITFHYIPRKTYESLVADGTLKQLDKGIV